MAQKTCSCCSSSLFSKESSYGVALVCNNSSCQNHWSKDGAEIIMQLR